jgi:hypothetical protein
MCNPASIVLTKDNAYWSLKTDSHEEILAEHNLRDAIAGKVQIVRCEVTPPNGDFFAPADQWRYRLDQDITPDWYDAEKCEKQARKALLNWIKARVYIGLDNIEIKDRVAWVKDSSTVMAYGSSTVTAYGSSTVTAYDSSTVTAYDSSTVMAYGSSTVTACGSSTVKAYGSSTVMEIKSKAIVIDRKTSTLRIYTAGKAELIENAKSVLAKK